MTQQNATPRIEGLLRTMTLEEKIGQLTMARGGEGTGGPELAPERLNEVRAGRVGSVLDIWSRDGIARAQKAAVTDSRLGIPLLICADVLHGYKTIFPIPLGEAAVFDPVLWEETARAAAAEAAADYISLTFAPMLDITRDPRWGRIAECPGEDPWIASHFAEAKVRGFQQGISRPDTLAATAKHLCAYGAAIAGRDYNSADISERSLHEIYLPPFAAAVRAGVAAIMPAFNDIAGTPMTAHSGILKTIVRERWGFDGVMISDYNAVGELIPHGVAADLVEAAALAMNAGVDIDMVSDAYLKGLRTALERGLVSETQIDAAVLRVLALKERLGLFDDPFRAQSNGAQPSRREAHRELARHAARRSIVLLQNRGDLLPLRGEVRTLAIIGPLAESKKDMLGPWHADGKAADMKDFLSGIREALPDWRIVHEQGAGIIEPAPTSFTNAVKVAQSADVILMCLGEAADMCGEATSRARPDLPECQRHLAEAVFALGKPVIVALSSGRPLIAPWLFEKADAVLATWFLGSEAGPALADVLTGQWNPSGKLPVCWPADTGQIPIFYAQRPTGRPAKAGDRFTSTYIDVPSKPHFPFGHGLSLTRFTYKALRISRETMAPGQSLVIEADIVNDGPVAGEETAFLFIRDPVACIARPVLELKGVAKVTLAPGAVGTVRFEIGADDVAFPDETGKMLIEAGRIEIFVGPRAEREALLTGAIELRSMV